MAFIQVQNLTKSFGDRVLFRDVSFDIYENDKIGLIGVNGCGKTTLLSLLGGADMPDGGTVIRSKNLRLGTLEQNLPSSCLGTLFDITLEVFHHLIHLEAELEHIPDEIDAFPEKREELIRRQYRIQEEFERNGGLTFRSRTRSALLGLGFSESDLNKNVEMLSGGEARKALLARLLLSDANLLFLDEPTNHLDLNAIQWLEEYLSSFKGAYVVISHDRYFLDKITDKTMEITAGSLIVKNGNYTRYRQLVSDDRENAERQYRKTLREIKRIEGIIEQQRRWNQARNYVTIASKEKQIERLKETLVKPARDDAEIRFRFSVAEPAGNEIVSVKDLSKSFSGKKLFNHVSFLIKKGEHVCLLGANGCGKTTLLRILLGMENQNEGTFKIGANVHIGYFEQTLGTLQGNHTVFDEIYDSFPRMEPKDVRNALGQFLFRGDDVFRKISVLSGGELARLQLLKLMLQKKNVLFLDEPTNHLDIKSREQLEEALEDYNGTLLIVSHDRYFINNVADRIITLTEDGIKDFTGDWEEYQNMLAAVKEDETEPLKSQNRNNEYVLTKEKRSETNRLKGEIRRIEKEIAAIDERITEIEKQLSDPAIASDYEKTSELSKVLAEMHERSGEMCEQWEMLEARLETMEE